jgi:hypothetical protein
MQQTSRIHCKRSCNYRTQSTSTSYISAEDERDLQNLRLIDIEIVSTLGVGGFGRVELVTSMIMMRSYTTLSVVSRFKIQEIQRNTVSNK